ncbi:hypothetical protein SSPIM334S_05979 [Streptomyces spiroverticillatus]
MPRAVTRRITSKRRSVSREVRVAVGSSMTRTRQSCHNVLAISRSCICAMPSRSTLVCGRTSRPTSSRRSCARRLRVRRSTSPYLRGSRWKKRFSATVRFGSRFSSWWTTWTPAFIAAAASLGAYGSPPRRMVPVSGGWMPARMRTRVDLPAPFSPSRACTSTAPQVHPYAVEGLDPGERLADAGGLQDRRHRFIVPAHPASAPVTTLTSVFTQASALPPSMVFSATSMPSAACLAANWSTVATT